MGNCCGSSSGAFRGQGHTLDEGDVQAARVSDQRTPGSSKKVTASGAGRKLGSDEQSGLSPKEAAARAAEARAAAQGSSRGALGQKLAQQKQQTQNATLAQEARDTLAARDADTATEVRNYN